MYKRQGCDTSGEANANYCYPEISCAVVDSGNTCTGPTDASADYTCSVSLQYYADPTDTSTQFVGDTWLSTIKAIDNGTAVHSTQVSAGVTLNTLLAYEITGSISYDSLGVGEGNTLLNKTITTCLLYTSYEQPHKIDFDTVIQNMHKDSLTMSPKGYFRWPIDMMKIHLRYYSQRLRNVFGAEDRS